MIKATNILYSKNGCMQCRTLKKELDREGIVYEEINLDENTEAFEYVVNELHMSSVPVLERREEANGVISRPILFSGNKRELIPSIVERELRTSRLNHSTNNNLVNA